MLRIERYCKKLMPEETTAAPRRQAQEKARVAGLARLIGRLEKDK